MAKRFAFVVAALVLVVGLIVARRMRLGRAAHPAAGESEKGNGVDFRLSPLTAGMDAPDGGTPCETAFLALSATDQAAKKSGFHVPWTTLPDRATFLARCNALPVQEQLCAQPRYAAQNHPVCDPIQKDYDKRSPLWD
jgi:hypothetical protein